MNSTNDPVAEVHEARTHILEEAGTLDALLETLMHRQAQKPEQIVSRQAVPAHVTAAA